jgi:hypothetical protein
LDRGTDFAKSTETLPRYCIRLLCFISSRKLKALLKLPIETKTWTDISEQVFAAYLGFLNLHLTEKLYSGNCKVHSAHRKP